jgi:hypothetical protein
MSTPLRSDRLEVKESKMTRVLIILLGVFFIPLGLGLLIVGAKDGEVVPLGLGIAMLLTFAIVTFISMRGSKKGVRYFSENGVGLADGTEVPYSELQSVVDKMAMRSATKKGLWRTELRFANGTSAWLIPNKISNFAEVQSFVRNLPCEHSQEAA